MPALLIIASSLGLLAAGPAAAAGKQRISTDPFTNPDSQHATQVEPDTFAWGSTIVSTFQSGRFFDGGSSDIGFATSMDGGMTWFHGFLPSMTVNSIPAGPYTRASDAAVAYDANHGVWMIASLGLGKQANGVAVLISRSTDGGMNWEAPVAVATTRGFFDKTWVTCDNSTASSHYGNCYVTFDNAADGNLLLTSTSSDGGLTWGKKKSPKDGAAGLGGQPLVQPTGAVIVPTLAVDGAHIIAYGSGNGGKSWAASTVVSDISEHLVAGSLRTSPLPSAEIDADGKVYVVWQDCRFRAGCSSNDIVMSTSTDGMTWTSPVRIPIDPVTSTVDHFIPGLAVDAMSSGDTARLALSYYFYPDANCTQDTCQLSVGFVSSVDGGASWSTATRLAGPMALTNIADTNQGFMVGDYISTSFSGANAVAVYSLGRPMIGSKFDQATFASSRPVMADDLYPMKVTNEPVLSPQGDRPERSHAIILP
jgi:hypothetical protein